LVFESGKRSDINYRDVTKVVFTVLEILVLELHGVRYFIPGELLNINL
jgi:hypothetical protein